MSLVLHHAAPALQLVPVLAVLKATLILMENAVMEAVLFHSMDLHVKIVTIIVIHAQLLELHHALAVLGPII